MGKVATEATLQTAVELLGVISRGGWSFDLEPDAIARIARSGHAADVFDVGDVIYIPWTDNSAAEPVTYNVPVVVADIRDGVGENDVEFHNGLWLQFLQSPVGSVPFDAPEIVPCEAGTVIEEGFYYYEMSGENYVPVSPAPTVGSEVPEGTTYYKHDLEGAGGAIRRGLNDYHWSARRQWLNSDAAAGAGWWTSQHPCDVAPAAQYLELPGFMNGFTDAWKAIFRPVRVRTRRPSVFGSNVNATDYDIFYLPSRSEMYGAHGLATVEGKYFQYWKNAVGTENSSESASVGRVVTRVDSTKAGIAIGMRTAFPGNAYDAYRVNADGSIDGSDHSNQARRSAPVCVIY